MTIFRSMWIIAAVLVFHAAGLLLGLYELFEWYDIPMHFAGGFAMGALALGIWKEGVADVRFHKWFERHLKWWLVPAVVLGFVALIGVLWEVHEWVLDELLQSDIVRQPSLSDTMWDFINDLGGGILALIIWHR